MRDELLNAVITDTVRSTELSKRLSTSQIKKLMLSIADDVGNGSKSNIGPTGKLGAYGFNVDALQEVGVLVDGAKDKLINNLQSGELDRVKNSVSAEFDPLSGGFSLGPLGKNVHGSFVDTLKDKIGGYLPDNVNLAAANNLNFGALADPSVWKAPVGSAANSVSSAVGTATGTINSVSSNITNNLGGVKTNILAKLNSSAPGTDFLSKQSNTINELSRNISTQLDSIKNNLPNASSLPSPVATETTSFANGTSSAIDALKREIDIKLADLKEVPAPYLVEQRFSEIENLISTFQNTQTQSAQSTLESSNTKLGGGPLGFLNDTNAQNTAMIGLLDRNIKTLTSAGLINRNTPVDTIMGLLSVANGQGIDTALKFAKGVIRSSSNGKSSLDYFNVGSRADRIFNDALDAVSIIDKGIETLLPSQLEPASGVMNPVITNQPSNEEFVETLPGRGFSDPNNIYPRKDFLQNENSDVNPAAIGRDEARLPYEQTTHGQNDASVARNKVVNGRSGETISQPKSEFNARYPHNQVYQSESGHMQEFDDTPGAERISLQHRSGTFTETGPDGSQVTRIVGHSYTIIDRHGTISIEGKANVHVGGTCNIYVGNDANISVGGKTRIDSHGKIEFFTGDDFHLHVGGNFNIRTNKFSLDAQSINMASAGEYAMSAVGAIGVSTGSRMSLESGGNIDLLAPSGVISSKIDTPIIDVTTANITTLNAGSTNLKATGKDTGTNGGSDHNLTVSGPTSASVDTPASAPRPVYPTILPDPIPPSTSTEPQIPEYVSARAASTDFAYDGDDGIADRETAEASDGSAPPGEGQEDVTSNRVAATSCSKAGLPPIDSRSADNKSFKLSERWNLGQVAFGQGNTKRIRSYGGFSRQDMVTNLRCLAVNCLDKIKAKYPAIIVTSGFRDFIPKGGSTTSQHLKGMAVDMSFTGYSRKEHINIAKWIVQNVPYDQCLLEFTARSHWIHLSFDHTKSSQRYQHFTMYNHKRVTSDGTFKSY